MRKQWVPGGDAVSASGVVAVPSAEVVVHVHLWGTLGPTVDGVRGEVSRRYSTGSAQ